MFVKFVEGKMKFLEFLNTLIEDGDDVDKESFFWKSSDGLVWRGNLGYELECALCVSGSDS
jgi:hypothetical protein